MFYEIKWEIISFDIIIEENGRKKSFSMDGNPI